MFRQICFLTTEGRAYPELEARMQYDTGDGRNDSGVAGEMTLAEKIAGVTIPDFILMSMTFWFLPVPAALVRNEKPIFVDNFWVVCYLNDIDIML